MSKRKRDYDEVSVVRDLNKKKDCMVNAGVITIGKNPTDLGNTSWGKIDFLVKVHKYIVKRDDDDVKQEKRNRPVNNFNKSKGTTINDVTYDMASISSMTTNTTKTLLGKVG